MSTAVYILAMAGVTYLIRMLPLTLFRRRINSRFVRSFLYYIPYAVLSAMTIPAVFYSTGELCSGLVGAGVAAVMAWLKLPLIVVALSASAAALLVGFII